MGKQCSKTREGHCTVKSLDVCKFCVTPLQLKRMNINLEKKKIELVVLDGLDG